MFKKVFCIILSAVLLLGVLPLAVSAADGSCSCGKDPIIHIDGMNACDLIRDKGTENERVAFPFEFSEILPLITDNKEAIWDLLDCRYSEENRKVVVDAVSSLFEDIEMTNSGDSKYDITPDWRPKTEDVHRSGGYYRICFDWRLDPYENAEILSDFIDDVLDLTGHSRVSIFAHSLGANVLNTYISAYGTEKISGCIWFCGAQNGVITVDELYNGRLKFNAQDVTSFLHEATEDTFEFQLLSILLQGLADIGITGSLLSFTNRIFKSLANDGSLREIIVRSFGKMPGIWALIDDSAYESAKDFMFPAEEDKAENAGLIERIDRYHYNVQVKADEIMQMAKSDVGKIAILSYYGFHITPVIADSDIMSDQVIDSARTSCGATFAHIGEKLPKSGTVSPDRMVDVSTALFPECTWIVKGLTHTDRPKEIDEFFSFIFDFDGQPTVNDNEKFPQLLTYNKKTETLSPQTKNDLKPAKLAARYREFILTLKWFIKSVFTKEFWTR